MESTSYKSWVSLWNWPVFLTRLNRVAQLRILNALVGICGCWSCSSEAKYSLSHLHVWGRIPFYSDLWKKEKWFCLYPKTDPLYMVETSTMSTEKQILVDLAGHLWDTIRLLNNYIYYHQMTIKHKKLCVVLFYNLFRL